MDEQSKHKVMVITGSASVVTLLGGGLAVGGQAVTAASFTATDESSLADAIANANANPGPDTITIGAGTITLTAALPDIDDELTVVGAGQGVTILDGAGAYRIFRADTATMLTISDMTLQNGVDAIPGINAQGGGAVFAYRTSLTLESVTVSNSYSVHPTGSAGAVAVWNRAGVPASLDVSDSTFDSNRSSRNDGALRASGLFSTVTISNSTFTSNSALGFDGALSVYCIYGEPCAVTLSDSVFAYNSAASFGGAGHIYAGGLGGSVTIERSTFKNNSASGRFATGALMVADGSVVVAESYFADNAAAEWTYSGALSLLRSPSATITDSTFTRNSTADGSGGAIRAYSVDELRIADSTFSYNDAAFAGALYVFGSESVTIENTTFNSNSASNRGGAINAFAGTIVIDQSTVSENAGGDAGAMRLYASSAVVRNSTIAANTSDSGGAVLIDRSTGSLEIVNSVISDNVAGVDENDDLVASTPSTSIEHSLIGVANVDVTTLGAGNIVSSDPGLGSLGDNGGNTATMVPLAGSPLIDAGDSSVHTFDTDQRGATRIVDVIDIGAVEATPAPPETTVPETTAPDTTVPETTAPETTVPDTTAPDTTAPDTTDPVASILPPTGGDGRTGLIAVLLTALGAVLRLGASRRHRLER